MGGGRSPDVVLDELRAENADLRARVTDLERQLEEARRAASQTALPADVPGEALPVLTRIEIDRLSDVRLRDADGASVVATIYVRFLDGRDRPVQGVGTLRAELALADPAAADPASSAAAPLAQVELSPSQVRDAYRSGFTGTHYTVTLTAPAGGPAADGLAPGTPVRLRVRFDDARGGPTLEASAERTLRPARTTRTGQTPSPAR